jgi:tetratricopeptide (TPR) repeat protein
LIFWILPACGEDLTLHFRHHFGHRWRMTIDEAFEQARGAHRAGDLRAAERLYRQILAAKPGHAGANHGLGLVGVAAKQIGPALPFLRAAVEAAPGELSYRTSHIDALIRDGQRAAAEVALADARAAGFAGEPIEALAARLDQAAAPLAPATPPEPDELRVIGLAAALLRENGHLEGAIEAYGQALAADPDHVDSLLNRGVGLRDLDRLEAAEADFRRAVAIAPDRAEAQRLLATTLQLLGRLDEAEPAIDAAIRLAPDHAESHWNRAIILLQRGHLAEGWREYEWGRKTADMRKATRWRHFDEPLWLGESPIAGRRILVHWEQGLGDTIHFSRYVPLLAERGADVLFAPQPQLRRLMRSLPGPQRLVSLDDRDLGFDLQVPLMSLPLAFGTELGSVPAAIPYLGAEPDRVAAWRERIGAEGLRIGVCWQGSTRDIDKGRSFPLAALEGVARIPGVRLISLHKGAGEEQLEALPPGMRVETFAAVDDGGDAFVDSAAIVAGCDLVISCDTAIAHLAGALGAPLWLALGHVPDWRWMLGRADSPWYPRARLFRQAAPGDWAGVFAEMARLINRSPSRGEGGAQIEDLGG